MRVPPLHAKRTVIVIGATGVFGERLVEGLLSRSAVAIVMVARNADNLQRLREKLRHAFPHQADRLKILAMDAREATAADWRRLGAWLLIDAAGPFQEASYGLPLSAVEAGLHYLDLSDGRQFVAGFSSAVDTAARRSGVIALTGVSSTPALSTSVVRHVTKEWTRVERIESAITSGNAVPRGKSVMRAILSYVGKPVRVRIDDRWTERTGWGWPATVRFSGIGRRWVSLIDVPDLDLLAESYPHASTITFRAGLQMGFQHLALVSAGLPVRWGLLRSLRDAAPLLAALARPLARYGVDRGAMVVDVAGRDVADRPISARWSLQVGPGAGPYVPTLPALAAVRALLDGRLTGQGASPCNGSIPLEWIVAEFVGHPISADVLTKEETTSKQGKRCCSGRLRRSGTSK